MISKDRVLELSKLCINAIHDKKTMIFDRIILVEYDDYISIFKCRLLSCKYLYIYIY